MIKDLCLGMPRIAIFETCKAELANATLLAHPIEGATLFLSTDASDTAIGASLEQTAIRQSVNSTSSTARSDCSIHYKYYTYCWTGSTTPLYCDISKGAIQSYVPETLRKRIFDAVHGIAYPRVTKHQIGQKFVWPKSTETLFIDHVPAFSASVTKSNGTPKTFRKRFQHRTNDSTKFTLISSALSQRWLEAIPLPNMAAQTVAAAFIDGWARFGTSAVITTDQGKLFKASLFQALSKFLGSKKTRTSPYHPASNGLIEKWHRTLKTAITCHEDGRQWLDLLPTVLLGLRTCLKEDLKCSPAELVYGALLRVPREFLENLDPTENTETFVMALRKPIL
ncbi:PREDICTED: uncharacterized protein LOC108748527 [Trachymyrmex septentrionalis]|uniref:uncharacterized protein LOC108748527 n=1 Tax=Trachymyrmex septentrionalis TaxID=34720 RepID=UPI00084F68AA|nr:PREDICTED: uncharacterized protein LOC108748527 [Trachymyrmex septentrionalis]